MSEMPGVGSYPAKLRRPIQIRNEGERSLASQPAKPKAAAPNGRGPETGPRFSGLPDLIGKLAVPTKVQDFFLATSKEGSTALLLPESSVVVGRSITSYKRDGWLELQERLPEELAVAAIWLFGVDKLRTIFEKQIKPRVFKNFNHLSTDIAWNRTWGKAATVDLTPQEMFTKNSKEINALLRLKSVRWLFSVGLALTTVAYLIPKANQWKTNLILKHLGRKKRETEGSNVQFGDPTQNPAASQPRTSMAAPFQPGVRASQPFNTSFNSVVSRTPQPFTAANTAAPVTSTTQQPFRSTTPYKHNNHPYSQKFQGGNQQAGPAPQGKSQTRSQAHSGVQFGGLLSSAAQGLGHLVEQTPYGSILVVDAGIAGGRAYVASRRSLFETAEVLFRDIGSLYFYILCAPHLMKLMGAGLDAAFKTSMNLQPKVADEIHQHILDQVKAGKAKLTPQDVTKILKGVTGPLADTLMQPEGTLKQVMRSTDTALFSELLEKELAVYLKGTESRGVQKPLLARLAGDSINAEQIQDVLSAIEGRSKEFAKLSAQERQNLITTVKQAFRHSVGIPVDLRKEAMPHRLFQELIDKLPPQEADALISRIRHAAKLDGMNQTHSMLRRSINVMQDVLGGRQTDLLKRGTQLADWMDEAVNRHLTMDEMQKAKPLGGKSSLSARDVQKQIQDFMTDILEKTGTDTPEKTLIEHYQQLITGMTRHKQGRLFSLAIDQQDATLAQKLRAMLKGGLENDHQFLNKALELVGQLETDSRKFTSTAKAAKMQEGISHYTDALVNRLRTLNGAKAGSGLKAELQRFLRLNQNLHYGAWTVALGTTMVCLGWLVPHLQTAMTKRLTGHDKHPGIASLDQKEDTTAKPAKPPAQAYTAMQPITPYTAPYANRGHYFTPPPFLRPAPNAYQRA